MCAKCCKRGPRGPPQTMKTMVSCTRNHYFQISTCTSKMTGNCFQWVHLWDPFGWFWGPLGDFFGDKKSMENLMEKQSQGGQLEHAGFGRKWVGPALRTNTPNGNDRALTRLEALHYRAEGTVADQQVPTIPPPVLNRQQGRCREWALLSLSYDKYSQSHL